VRYILILFVLVSFQNIHAQERYLTQFYGSPITLTLLTGNFEGNYRINLAYRNQLVQHFLKIHLVYFKVVLTLTSTFVKVKKFMILLLREYILPTTKQEY
jgi:hypothetical protein